MESRILRRFDFGALDRKHTDAENGPVPVPDPATLTYAGTAACRPCHTAASHAWSGSHHDLAMQEPTPKTVLGAFDGVERTLGGETFRFARDAGAFTVEVGGKTYPVKFTFGVAPLDRRACGPPIWRAPAQALGPSRLAGRVPRLSHRLDARARRSCDPAIRCYGAPQPADRADRHPTDASVLSALAAYSLKAGRGADAESYGTALRKLAPGGL